MKKYFLFSTILTGMMLLSLHSGAQQSKQIPVSPKPPELIGKKLDSDKLTNVVQPLVSPAVPVKDITPTTVPGSSEGNAKITKVNDPEPAKAKQESPQAPTVKLVVPDKPQKEYPDAIKPPPPTIINH